MMGAQAELVNGIGRLFDTTTSQIKPEPKKGFNRKLQEHIDRVKKEAAERKAQEERWDAIDQAKHPVPAGAIERSAQLKQERSKQAELKAQADKAEAERVEMLKILWKLEVGQVAIVNQDSTPLTHDNGRGYYRLVVSELDCQVFISDDPIMKGLIAFYGEPLPKNTFVEITHRSEKSARIAPISIEAIQERLTDAFFDTASSILDSITPRAGETA